MRLLLSTFITGNDRDVFPPLLQLMDTYQDPFNGNPNSGMTTIKWILSHMRYVLDGFKHSLSSNMRALVNSIIDLIYQFRNSKEKSGDGWEALFVLTLLIRAVSGHLRCDLLPSYSRSDQDLSVSYNTLCSNLTSIKTLDQLLEQIQRPKTYPHISIYYPNHAQFEQYDVVVFSYDDANTCFSQGFQLKEGNSVPGSHPSSRLDASYVIRGNASTSVGSTMWHLATDEQLKEFFGESGQNWTPSIWRILDR
jgi:hypothetical protein